MNKQANELSFKSFSSKMGCFSQKTFLRTGAEKSQALSRNQFLTKGRFVSADSNMNLFSFLNKELESVASITCFSLVKPRFLF